MNYFFPIFSKLYLKIQRKLNMVRDLPAPIVNVSILIH